MPTIETVDITSKAFALRMANLLVATRTRKGQSVRAVARSSGGRFGVRELKAFERAEVGLDETIVDELAVLYRCDLGTILPARLPVMVSAGRVSAGGVYQEVEGSDSDSVLSAYLTLVRTLRRQKNAPVVDLRRDDIAVLAGFLNETQETVVHRLATLMHATQVKRTAMVSVLATGAAVVGLVGSAMALDAGESSTPVSTDSVVVTVESVPTSVPDDSVVATDSATTTTITVEITEPTTSTPTVTTRPPVIVPVTQRPTTTIPMIDTDLTTTTTIVDSGDPALPLPTP